MGHVIYGGSEDDQGPLLNRVSITQYVIAVAVVAVRFITRIFIVRKFGLDDYFMALAVIFGGAQTTTMILQVENGRGRHTSELHLEQYNTMLMWKWVNTLVYFLANWAVKLSILALYYRIGSVQKGLGWILRPTVIWSMAGFVTLFTASICMIQLLSCLPISRAWDAEGVSGDCIDPGVFAKIQGAINVFTDLALLVFPLPLLRVLKINKKQRTSLLIIFSIGLVPLVASGLRLCEVFMSSAEKWVSWKESDTSWTWAWVPLWSQIEVDVGVVAASLPSLNPLLQRVWSGFAATRTTGPDETPTLVKPEDGWGTHWASMEADSDKGGTRNAKRSSWYDVERVGREENAPPSELLPEIAVTRSRMLSIEYPVRHTPGG